MQLPPSLQQQAMKRSPGLSRGMTILLGVFAEDHTNPTDVAFSNAQVWKL